MKMENGNVVTIELSEHKRNMIEQSLDISLIFPMEMFNLLDLFNLVFDKHGMAPDLVRKNTICPFLDGLQKYMKTAKYAVFLEER